MNPINITQDLIQVNPFSRDGSKLKSKKGIVLHYTASPGAPAKNISHYFNGLKDQNPRDNVTDRYAGAHFSVDRTSKVQSIPTNERGYHCGSSQLYLPDAIRMLGTYPNDNTVGIEMCIEADGSIHEDTFQNTADLVVWLIKNEGFPNVLFTHKGVVGWKDCPLPWVKQPSEFERFKQVVNAKLTTNEEDEEMKEELAAAIKRIEALELKTKALDKTPAPEWFLKEFGEHALDGIVSDMNGDTDFWRDTAVSLRFKKKG